MKKLIILLFSGVSCFSATVFPHISPATITNIATYGGGNNPSTGLDRMYKFRDTVSRSNRCIRVLGFGDQGDYPCGGAFRKQMVLQGFPIEGGLLNGDNVTGRLKLLTNGLVPPQSNYATESANIVFGTTGYWYVTNGGTLTWSRDGGGATGVADTNLYCDTIQFSYLRDPNGTSYIIKTNGAGGVWNTLATVSANQAGATNGAYTNFSVALGYYSVQITATSGTNRIYDASIYNSTARNYVWGYIPSTGGPSFQTMTNCQTNVIATFMAGWNPDLIVFMDTGGPANGGALTQIETWLGNTCTNADVVYSDWFAIDQTLIDESTYFHDLALTNVPKRGYFSVSYLLPQSDIVSLTNAGFVSVDDVHVSTPKGNDYLNTRLFEFIFGASANTNGSGLLGIPMTGIVQPGQIVTNGNSTAIIVSNNWSIIGTLTTRGAASGLVFYDRATDSTLTLYVPTANELTIRPGNTDYIHLYTNNIGQVSIAPINGASVAVDCGDGTQGWRNMWMEGANKEFWQLGQSTEQLTLATGAATTDTSASLLPANSIIEAVVTRVTTTITTAATFSVGDPTTAARFSASAAGITANSTRIGIDHWSGAITTLAAGPSQAAAAKVRITCNANPGAGIIRITVFYRTFVAPAQ